RRRNSPGGLRKRYPLVAGCRLAEAVVKVAAKKAKEALPELEKLAKEEPTSFDLFVFEALGDAYHQAGKSKEAVAAWKKALALFPKTAKADDRRRKAIRKKLEEIDHEKHEKARKEDKDKGEER